MYGILFTVKETDKNRKGTKLSISSDRVLVTSSTMFNLKLNIEKKNKQTATA